MQSEKWKRGGGWWKENVSISSISIHWSCLKFFLVFCFSRFEFRILSYDMRIANPKQILHMNCFSNKNKGLLCFDVGLPVIYLHPQKTCHQVTIFILLGCPRLSFTSLSRRQSSLKCRKKE